MVKIHRAQFTNEQDVTTLAKALPWDGEGKFTWSIKINDQGFNIRKKILPILLKMTQKHCAFCDFYPLSEDLLNPIPIEHFYPKCKGKFPEKAYQWDNLFPSCNGCTAKKRDRFDEKLLKPDDQDYTFEAYFKVTGDGKLEPSDTSDKNSKERVKTTIDIYKLNERGELLSERKRWVRDFLKLCPIQNRDEYPFRFIIPIAQQATNPDEIINSFIE